MLKQLSIFYFAQRSLSGVWSLEQCDTGFTRPNEH